MRELTDGWISTFDDVEQEGVLTPEQMRRLKGFAIGTVTEIPWLKHDPLADLAGAEEARDAGRIAEKGVGILTIRGLEIP